ncbi:zf-TFIIB domain-containing protein [Pseudoalteromonas ardens]|uniref:GTP-binding protein EngA n=1 Tax=Pseudoalteromonas rubra TaxID=43658 RepID=A0A0L0EY50_9GAMM|nr:zf-TFIIB domain-containing protein [Pseudoalteromonas sp. R96]KNC68738.1 GTP-binding protein EngA [Pseudoalteromonas rubra]MDK1310294.1 zf-TFIIB domain-containing protein [Pseudoalteromonas sp. R96]
MQCPRTSHPLKPVKVGGIKVYISEHSGGVFFDNQVLSNFTNPSELRAEVLAKHLRQFSAPLGDESARVKCPKCPDIVMMRRYFSPLRVVEIDECPGCGGIWLDTGELDTLHENHLSAKEREMLRIKMLEEHQAFHIDSPRRYKLSEQDGRSNLEKVFAIAADVISD